MSTYRNKILQHLAPAVIERLNLKRIDLELEHEMEYTGSHINRIFFIGDGVGSMTSTFQDGSQVEVGLFGYESVIGISALMGTKRSLNRIYMQIAGWGYVSPVPCVAAEFASGGEFQRLALRYVQMQLTQATQSAACNAKHDLEQRLSRWLLLCADRSRSDSFHISQQFLANMLGVARASINVIAGQLRKEGLLEYRRNQVHIPSIPALEKRTCECYSILRDHLENYTEFDTGFVV